MTSGSGVCCLSVSGLVRVWFGAGEICRPTSDECLGQPQRWTADFRASRQGEEEEEEEKKLCKSKNGRQEEEQASAVVGTKVESAPSYIQDRAECSSQVVWGWFWGPVEEPSRDVRYLPGPQRSTRTAQYGYSTVTLLYIVQHSRGGGGCGFMDVLAQRWRSAEARRPSVLEARVLQAGQLGRYQVGACTATCAGTASDEWLWHAWDSLPTFWIWRAQPRLSMAWMVQSWPRCENSWLS
ncbi:uncharacterized protein TRIVIDRAFT_62397 [Trichoderma virens Gv29-8]|uniref:Uncharacterized protein n=1 Tax=Hypocrea virens (strain Gv29-8 / FGSC 10586) TaxID=413071 RepID=G9MJR8_HYPVG|nr:uncharacterized protein TRIVIDRAFT_62397 [Trichoderma virens Gv29-8]EHK25730.1 hypothetical protein TRIVIDRAFT_62397 [Trichoderma virens Gv29-8]